MQCAAVVPQVHEDTVLTNIGGTATLNTSFQFVPVCKLVSGFLLCTTPAQLICTAMAEKECSNSLAVLADALQQLEDTVHQQLGADCCTNECPGMLAAHIQTKL